MYKYAAVAGIAMFAFAMVVARDLASPEPHPAAEPASVARPFPVNDEATMLHLVDGAESVEPAAGDRR